MYSLANRSCFSVPFEEQMAAFEPPGEGEVGVFRTTLIVELAGLLTLFVVEQVKVIIATNAAESSVTLPGKCPWLSCLSCSLAHSSDSSSALTRIIIETQTSTMSYASVYANKSFTTRLLTDRCWLRRGFQGHLRRNGQAELDESGRATSIVFTLVVVTNTTWSPSKAARWFASH